MYNKRYSLPLEVQKALNFLRNSAQQYLIAQIREFKESYGISLEIYKETSDLAAEYAVENLTRIITSLPLEKTNYLKRIIISTKETKLSKKFIQLNVYEKPANIAKYLNLAAKKITSKQILANNSKECLAIQEYFRKKEKIYILWDDKASEYNVYRLIKALEENFSYGELKQLKNIFISSLFKELPSAYIINEHAQNENIITFLKNCLEDIHTKNIQKDINKNIAQLNKIGISKVIINIKNNKSIYTSMKIITKAIIAFGNLNQEFTQIVTNNIKKLVLTNKQKVAVQYNKKNKLISFSNTASFQQISSGLIEIFFLNKLFSSTKATNTKIVTEKNILALFNKLETYQKLPQQELENTIEESTYLDREDIKRRIFRFKNTNPYIALGINPYAAEELQQKKYYELLMMFHPDLYEIHKDSQTTEITKTINYLWQKIKNIKTNNQILKITDKNSK